MEKRKYTGLEIAVIGMAARFPGAACIDDFWQNLCEGKESIATLSRDELLKAGVSEELVENERYVPSKGIIDDAEQFDESFFGYTPREAQLMDPQIRLMHQCAWHALEDAGYDPFIYTKRIGLYAGASSNPQWLMSAMQSGHGSMASFVADRDYICSRVAHKLNLTGPAVFVQTACSTSLVSIHLACRALLTGDCEMAIAGGASLKVPHKVGYVHQEGSITSPDGHCRSFDALADGTVAGEGIGLVLLKPLRNAIADNDNIHAIIKASAINNDGRDKGSFSSPSITGQVDVIRRAHRVGKVEPDTIGFVEAHGTGTNIGDPIEFEALRTAFNMHERERCIIGSVKSNIGHLDHAAGVAGFIKATLSLKYGKIPATVHFTSPNPKLKSEASPFYVNASLVDWPVSEQVPRRASVNSLGIGGTNAYVILEEYEHESVNSRQSGQHLFVMSARSESQLREAKRQLAMHIDRNPEIIERDLSHTLMHGRHQFAYKEAWLCSSITSLSEQLKEGEKSSIKPIYNDISGSENCEYVFLFPGQGSQFPRMGKAIYDTVPVFKCELDRLFDKLGAYSTIKFKEIWQSEDGEGGKIYETEVAQPLLFIFEFALAKTLQAAGIIPHAMLGHSLGEFTAAAVSGVIDIDQALQLVCVRGHLMQSMAPGSMVSAKLSLEEAHRFIKDGISIAAVNAPGTTVLSGEVEAIEGLCAFFEREQITYKALNTSHAFHSSMVESISRSFTQALSDIDLCKPVQRYISNVTGTWIKESECCNPKYWVSHMRNPVLFSDGVKTLTTLKKPVFIEVGPGNALTRFVINYNKNLHSAVLPIVPPVHSSQSSLESFMQALGRLWLGGQSIDWQGLGQNDGRRISVPGYPFLANIYPFPQMTKWKPAEFPQFIKASSECNPGNVNTGGGPDKEKSIVAMTPTQVALLDIFKRALGVTSVGIDDDFFSLGGDSLTAISVIAIIHKKLNVKLTIATFFEKPSIFSLAQEVDAREKSEHVSIPIADIKPYYTMSAAQLRFFIMQQTELDNTGYNETFETYLIGKLDKVRFANVINGLIKRHEVLRTSYHLIGSQVVQKIEDETTLNIEYYTAIEKELEQTLSNFVRPFKLEYTPLFRVAIVTVTHEKHLLLMDFHHILMDGVSMSLLIKEMIALYEGSALPEISCHYKDFSEWQNSEEQKKLTSEQKAYWLNKFTERPMAPLALPTDFPRPKFRTFEGQRVNFQLDVKRMHALKTAAQHHGASLFMFLLAAYNVLLSKLSGAEDIAVGTVVAGRRHEAVQSVIGVFINTLILRNFPKREQSFKLFLSQVRESSLEAFENQEYPYEDLIEELDLKRDASRNTLFDVAFVLQNMADGKDMPDSMGDIALQPYHRNKDISKFDMTLTAYESVKGIQFSWDYSTNLFARETIDYLVDAYLKILSSVMDNPDIKLKDIMHCERHVRLEKPDLEELEDWVF